ncbi:MAG: sodium-independent anion transporter, partial [Oscillospiraceae bacterium]
PDLHEKQIIIFSMRGVPYADASGVQTLQELVAALSEKNIVVYFTAVQPPVMEMFDRCGLSGDIGADSFFWSTDKALDKLAEN